MVTMGGWSPATVAMAAIYAIAVACYRSRPRYTSRRWPITTMRKMRAASSTA